MPDALKLGFGAFTAPAKGVLIVFCDDKVKFGPATTKAMGPAAAQVARAAKAAGFTGKKDAALELIAPEGLKVDRLVVIGAGKADRPETPGFPEVRRARHGQGSRPRQRRRDLRRTARRRHDRGPGRRAGAGGAPARLRLRPLQDQAQGGGQAARPTAASPSPCAMPPPPAAPSPRSTPSPAASSSRATWSTSRPTSFTRPNSPAAPPR